jgi:hypothetical protein
MSEVDLEPLIDELYAVDLDEFTARRDARAKELRAEGRRAAAQQVKELRKPSVAAWAVNQLARRNRRDVDLLLDAGHRAREAQRGLLEGEDRAGLEQALQTERRALQTLLGAAREILRARGSDPTPALLEKISQTLRAAAITDEGREAIALGRLTKELEPAGFEAFTGLAPAKRPRRQKAKKTDGAATPRAELQAARKRHEAAQERLRTVERRLKEAEGEAKDLRRQLQRADDDVEALRDEAGSAREERDAAKKAFDRARRRS